jgi:hypothetical protein
MSNSERMVPQADKLILEEKFIVRSDIENRLRSYAKRSRKKFAW